MDFPLGSLLDESACYEFLVSVLHPKGLGCPRGHGLDRAYVHKKDRAPILDYRCKACGRCFNVFTGTVFQNTKHNAAEVVQILRGVCQGTPTAQLAREMGASRYWLLLWRHKLQALVAARRVRSALTDTAVEADEMYQNAGEKRGTARRSLRPATSPRQPGARPRHLRARPASDRRGGRTRQRAGAS